MSGNRRSCLIDVEVYTDFGDGHFAQAQYLVHGYDDVYWLDTIDSVGDVIKNELIKFQIDRS